MPFLHFRVFVSDYYLFFFSSFYAFQILDWLSNSPTDIESYIRPGCVILTIYLQMDESTWEEVSVVDIHC